MTAPESLVPGVYYDYPVEAYHADPVPGGSLSSTGARLLLPPSCPAKYRYAVDHGQPPKDAWDFGSVAHRLVLGRGDTIEVVDADSWRTKAASTARDEARAAGRVPILTAAYAEAEAMAQAVADHPVAGPLFTPGEGDAEVVLVWSDDETGVMCRALIDWIPHRDRGRRVIVDYKTAVSASPDDIPDAVARHHLHQQAEHYLDGVRVLFGTDPALVFVFQEKTPPYLVTVAQLDAETSRSGRIRNRWARQVYRWCTDRGEWPGYAGTDVTIVGLPPWHQEPE